MIKSLSNITDISVIDQNVKINIISFSKIEFDDNILGSGGFGSVHNVQSIDGIPKSEFVLKIFTDEEHKQHAYDVIKLLHDKLKKRQIKTGIPIYHDLPELLGLPFIVFKGYDNISEKHCVAFLMYNLEKFDYEDYGSDTSKLDDYKSLCIPDKLYLAYQLTKTIEFLHQIEFIHADISENSLWFNSKRIQLAIIDYDSGYHFDSQDKPTTIGKIGHWISGGFRNIIGQKKDSSKLTTIDRLYEEYWVLANATFEVVFGVMPFFFLSDTDDNTKQVYLKEFEWPNIDYSSSLFNAANTQQHQAIVSFIEQLEKAGAADLITAFKSVFNKGYKNEAKRLTSKEWKKLLLNINKSLENIPLIKTFISNKNTIKQKNEEVEFSFDTQKFNAIYLNNKLIPLHQNATTLAIQDKTKIILKTVNDFATVEKYIEIEAIKVDPKIIDLIVSNYKRTCKEDSINVQWVTENTDHVKIHSIMEALVPNGSIDLFPIQKTKYKLTAIGFFGQEVNKEFETDVIKPVIVEFDYNTNIVKGIENVDLHWKTKNCLRVKITPLIGEKDCNGEESVNISGSTVFKLQAIGDFSTVERTIDAHPFPRPIIKELLFEYPKLHRSFQAVDCMNLKEYTDVLSINMDNTISIVPIELAQPIELDSEYFNVDIDVNVKVEINGKEFINLDVDLIKKQL